MIHDLRQPLAWLALAGWLGIAAALLGRAIPPSDPEEDPTANAEPAPADVPPTRNETGESSVEDAVARGRLTYRIHCETCHGPEGTGEGPMAGDLCVDVPDLRTLRRGNDGELPVARLRLVIDGRLMLRGHGSREMPVWGVVFGEPGKTWDSEPEIRGRIDDVIAFLDTLQEPLEDDRSSAKVER